MRLDKFRRISGLTRGQIFLLEIVRIIREAAQARRWANGFPTGQAWKMVYDEAVEAIAERLGVKSDTIRRDKDISAVYDLAASLRDFGIRMMADLFPMREIAAVSGTSVKTVHKVIHSPIQRKDADMPVAPLPTDESLAGDVARFQRILDELGSIASRLAQRFPADAHIAEAVDRLLADLPRA